MLPTILAVEDDPHQMELLLLSIQALPGPVVVAPAYDGAEAVQRLETAVPAAAGTPLQLVLLDLRLPRMHGLDVLAHARRCGWTERVPFVVFTSSDSIHEREQALELGAKDYQVKPMGLRPLKALVAELYQRWVRASDAAGDGEGPTCD